MPEILEKSAEGIYEAAGGKINFSPDYVVEHTRLPKKTPRIIGWSGPARSGTTAMLLLFANCDEVDRVYFQPQKTLLRKGGPDFVVRPEDKLVCLKEVFGQHYPEECYDPIDMLIRAGAKPEMITWISILRDPQQTFASWNVTGSCDPKIFELVQKHTLNLFKEYRDKGIDMVPFTYELFEGQETRVVKALMDRLDLTMSPHIEFDGEAIFDKVVWGQATNHEYFGINIEPTMERRKFVYSRNHYPLSLEDSHEIEKRCRNSYQEFYNLSKHELGLNDAELTKAPRSRLAYSQR